MIASPAYCQVQTESAFAPTVSFEGENTSWAIENRSFLSETMSLRSRVSFSNSAPGVGTKYSTSLNYNLNMGDPEQTFSPFLGAGISYETGINNRTLGFAQAGLDMYFDGLVVTGSVAIPFTGDAPMSTSIGLGFRF
jgi:hypothetical protein